MALGAGPDTVEQLEAEVFLVEVAIPVTGEVTRAVGDGEGTGDALARILSGANVGLVVTETAMFRPELRTRFNGHTGGAGYRNGLGVEALGVEVELDDARPAFSCARGGHRGPKSL